MDAHLFICSTFQYELRPRTGENEHSKSQEAAPEYGAGFPFVIWGCRRPVLENGVGLRRFFVSTNDATKCTTRRRKISIF